MKKFFSTIAIALIPFISISAQSEEPKQYLPEQGDMAIGFSATPVLKYVGNIFNNTSDNELAPLGGTPASKGFFDEYNYENLAPTVSIMGKYMLSDKWGIRANVGLMFNKDKYNAYVRDDKAVMLNPFDESKLIDTRHTSRNGMSLLLGTEYRKGERRIQGVFGMGVLFGFISEKTSYDYANAITAVNQRPSMAWDWNSAYRTLNKRTEKGIFYGITGSAGIEWFVAPKVSLGAEVNLSMYYINGGQEYTTSEGYNNALQKVEVRTDLTSPGSDTFRFGTENLGGSLYMAFYF